MRRLERMQMGIALAGVLLCLTSATASLSSERKTAVAATAQRTISGTVQQDLTKCASVRIYGYPGDLNYTVFAHRQQAFRDITRAVNRAKITSRGKGIPIIKLVFYNRQGSAQASVYETDTGCLLEPTHGLYFKANPRLQEMLQQVKRTQYHQEARQ